MIETIGILWLETLGAYLIGRCYVRTPEAFYSVVKLLFLIGMVIFPFAVYQAITNQNIILTFFSKLGPTYYNNVMEPRLGLNRAQGPFPHQIHFGVFFLLLSGLVYYVLGYNRRWIGRIGALLAVTFLGVLSLSSGPLVASMAQLNIIIWDGLLRSVRNRWYIFTAFSVLAFILIDLISNRTPFHVVIEYLALNKETAYNRIRIWEYGTASIFEHPLFGIGFNLFEKPYWMSDSVDMFWILPAMRHGVVVWALWITLFLSIFLSVLFRRNLGERISWYRTGYLVTMFGMFAAGWTVHYWDITYAYFMFLLASGVWILDWSDDINDIEEKSSGPEKLDYTRFSRRRRNRFPPAAYRTEFEEKGRF